jgi:hypothetical protein
MRELVHTRELRVRPSSGRTSTGRPAAGNDRVFRSPDRRFESYRGAIESPLHREAGLRAVRRQRSAAQVVLVERGRRPETDAPALLTVLLRSVLGATAVGRKPAKVLGVQPQWDASPRPLGFRIRRFDLRHEPQPSRAPACPVRRDAAGTHGKRRRHAEGTRRRGGWGRPAAWRRGRAAVRRSERWDTISHWRGTVTESTATRSFDAKGAHCSNPIPSTFPDFPQGGTR